MAAKLSRRKKYAIAAIVLIVVLVEVYAQTYVEINALEVVPEKNARSQWSSPGGSERFVVGSCEWVFTYSVDRPQSNHNDGHVWVYIYKVAENSSLIASSTGIYVSSVRLSPVDDVYFLFKPEENIIYGNNCTYLRLDLDFMGNGTFPINLNFNLQFYQRTIIGIMPIGQVNVPINATVVAWKSN